MNNQSLLFNIPLTMREVNTVLNSLSERSNEINELQKKIFNDASEQQKNYEKFVEEQKTKAEDASQAAEQPTQTQQPEAIEVSE